MSYYFSLAVMANSLAMTLLLVALNLAGRSAMSVDVGIVHGATLALFYSFSANARSLILNRNFSISAESILAFRLILLAPLAFIAYLLATAITDVDKGVAVVLLVRRCVEWLSEVHLSEMERNENKRFARNYIIVQIGFFALSLIWILTNLPYMLVGLMLWGLAPLLLSTDFLTKTAGSIGLHLKGISFRILPHLGSTAIIGITVYVFRLLILLLLGKNSAGDLYAAFALGGISGNIFANVLGPSVALHEQRSSNKKLPRLIEIVLYLSVLTGVLLFGMAALQAPVMLWGGKSYFFWMAAGLSMVGGGVMVWAQRLRFRLLQHNSEHDVFGPDVLMNIILISSIPFTYYIFGKEVLTGLYLFSALLAFIFYTSAIRGENTDAHSAVFLKRLSIGIGLGVLLPLFFQAHHIIFRDQGPVYYDTLGLLSNLPVPISVIACSIGILLIGAYRQSYLSIAVLFFVCLLMCCTTILSAHTNESQLSAKFITLIQCILPMFGLVLGQMLGSIQRSPNSNWIEKGFLCVLLIVVPWQLIATWSQGALVLSPYLTVFSVYQHLQYVPVIFVSAYLVTITAFFDSPKFNLLLSITVPIMSLYAAASIALLAIGMLLLGLLGVALYKWLVSKKRIPALLFAVSAALCFSYVKLELQSESYKRISDKFNFMDTGSKTETHQQEQSDKQSHGASGLAKPSTPQRPQEVIDPYPNVTLRIQYWNYYLERIVSSPGVFLVGNPERPNRKEMPSAHNYFLDITYNFGFIAIIPLLFLIIFTGLKILQCRKKMYRSPVLISLCCVVIFLVLVDNSLKVGLRQPYPGIFTFFLWGVLLCRLMEVEAISNPQVAGSSLAGDVTVQP